MNKGQLIDKVASDAALTKAQAGIAVNAFMDAVRDALRSGDKVTLVGFGTFSVGKRSARTARNPKTGASIQVEAKKVVKFKAGKELDEVVG